MDSFFVGKRVVVTGAGQGIGREVAKELAKHGAEVFAVSRTPSHLESLKTEVPNIKTAVLDVSDWTSTEYTIKTLLPIDLLVNNAGVASLEPVGHVTEDEYNRVFAVNVKAALNISQVVAEDLKSRGAAGAIVNVSSQASMVAIQDHTVYCASKAALDQITKVMALELGPHKIRVNSVNPTVVMTEMGKRAWSDPKKSQSMLSEIPLGQFCDPTRPSPCLLIPTGISSFKKNGNTFMRIETHSIHGPTEFMLPNHSEDALDIKEPVDVVNAVMFLLSDKSSMVTGACLPIDGGYTIH